MDRVTQDGMRCTEFEALMAEALDGKLAAREQARFEAHRAGCTVCAPMYEEALAGMRWMRSLAEVEPPANLVHNILVATVGAVPEAQEAPPKTWRERMKARLPRRLAPVFATFSQPRFAMSFGMAFFSVTLLLNMLGLRLSDIRAAELSPGAIGSAVVETYNQTAAKVVRYYENLRFVYEIETRVRDLREAAAPATEEPANPPAQEQPNEDRTRGPAERQQNYSRSPGKPNLALHLNTPALRARDDARQGRDQS